MVPRDRDGPALARVATGCRRCPLPTRRDRLQDLLRWGAFAFDLVVFVLLVQAAEMFLGSLDFCVRMNLSAGVRMDARGRPAARGASRQVKPANDILRLPAVTFLPDKTSPKSFQERLSKEIEDGCR